MIIMVIIQCVLFIIYLFKIKTKNMKKEREIFDWWKLKENELNGMEIEKENEIM